MISILLSVTIRPLQVARTSEVDMHKSWSIIRGRPNCPSTRRSGNILSRRHDFRYTRTETGRSSLENDLDLEGARVSSNGRRSKK